MGSTLRVFAITHPEIPVVVCFHDQSNWLLLSTRRVVLVLAGSQTQIPWRDITYFGPTQQELFAHIHHPTILEFGLFGIRRKIREPVENGPWLIFAGNDVVRHKFHLDEKDKGLLLELVPFMMRLEKIHPVHKFKKT